MWAFLDVEGASSSPYLKNIFRGFSGESGSRFGSEWWNSLWSEDGRAGSSPHSVIWLVMWCFLWLLESMKIEISLPDWLETELDALSPEESWSAGQSRMEWVLSLAHRNIEARSGGPFAAAVFEKVSGRLVSVGVNRVVPCHTSIAHAETVALALAQQKLESHDLAAAGLPEMELVASAQPCIQCFGNTWWSGVRGLLIGARAQDVEEIVGFHEGPLPAGWPELLENRPAPLPSVSVTRDLLREEARAVLARYRDMGGFVYNAGGE